MMMAANLDRCEVPGCQKYATQTHHIYGAGAHGDSARVPANLFKVCAEHHTLTDDSWHTSGRETFSERHGLTARVREARMAVKGY